jgi:nucleoside-diphosphate-sugar epimerase
MDSILVTGSLGFIGREIIKKITKTKIITDSNNSKRINLQNINEVLEIDPADTVIHLIF